MKRYRTLLTVIDTQSNYSHTFMHEFRTIRKAKAYKQAFMDSVNPEYVSITMTIYERNSKLYLRLV